MALAVGSPSLFAQPSQSGPPPQQNEQPDNNQPTSTQESNSSSNPNTTQETNGTKAPPEAAAAPPAQAAAQSIATQPTRFTRSAATTDASAQSIVDVQTNPTPETGDEAPARRTAEQAQAAYKEQAVIDRLLTAPDNNLIELFETPEADENDSASQDAASVDRFAKEDEPAFANARAETEPREGSRQPLDMAV